MNPYKGDWPVRIDERIIDEPERWVQSTCILCSTGCGMDIGVKNGRMVGVRGREEDRVNKERLGPKGLHGWESTHSADHLTCPLIRKNGTLQPAGWDEVINLIVQRSQDIIKAHTALGIGFYTSGQLLLEEYYTLALLSRGGLGTPHVDGNTRLCTATAAKALMQSFGTDGQPGTYADLDITETILHAGHNIASQQTVLWMRILDRRHSANPPKLIAIDPRTTATAKEADVHLAPRLGTNLPLMDGLLALIIKGGNINNDFIQAHTVDFDQLEAAVANGSPLRVQEVTRVQAKLLEYAADILGRLKNLTQLATLSKPKTKQTIQTTLSRFGETGVDHQDPQNEKNSDEADLSGWLQLIGRTVNLPPIFFPYDLMPRIPPGKNQIKRHTGHEPTQELIASHAVLHFVFPVLFDAPEIH